MEKQSYSRNDLVTVLVDVPRLGVKAGGQVAHVDAIRGEDLYEISWYDATARKQVSLIVLQEWIGLVK